MNVIKCEKGHFYDSDKYSNCPHCGNAFADNETVTIAKASSGGALDETVSIDRLNPTVPLDDEKTVGYWGVASNANESADPCVGWLVCTKGSHLGKDFRLKSGRNFIGRDMTMDICLAGETKVSRDKHAVVIYDPKQNCFLAQPGESRELFYLNGNLVINAEKIQKGDRIELGDVELIFIPLCDESFHWENKE